MLKKKQFSTEDRRKMRDIKSCSCNCCLILLLLLLPAINCLLAQPPYIMQKECAKVGNHSFMKQMISGNPLSADVVTSLQVRLTDRHGYEANLDCSVTFKSEPNRVLLFKLDDLEMERSRDCVNDFLLISNTMRGDVVLCGSGKRVDSFYSFNSTITLRFVSNRDLLNTMRGFSGYFTTLHTGKCLEMPGMYACKNGFCIDETLECNTFDNCGDNSDEILCKEKQWYIISIVTASLILCLCAIAGSVTYLTRRRKRLLQQNNAMSSKTEDGGEDDDEGRKQQSNSDDNIHFQHSKSPLSAKEDWSRLIFQNKKEGQLHLYALPSTQSFVDVGPNAVEQGQLNGCPDFVAVQELLLSTGGTKGFLHPKVKNLKNYRQASLHQLCALCLLTNMDDKAKQPSSEAPMISSTPIMPNLLSYKCPNACNTNNNNNSNSNSNSNKNNENPKIIDPTAFFLTPSEDEMVPSVDSTSTPKMTVLSRPPSFYLAKKSTGSSPPLMGKTVTTAKQQKQLLLRKVPTGETTTLRSFSATPTSTSSSALTKINNNNADGFFFTSNNSNNKSALVKPKPPSCLEQLTPAAAAAAVANSSHKRTVSTKNVDNNDYVDINDEETDEFVVMNYKTGRVSPGSRGAKMGVKDRGDSKSNNNQNSNNPRRTLSHDIVCKHKGKRVRILSKMMTVPAINGNTSSLLSQYSEKKSSQQHQSQQAIMNTVERNNNNKKDARNNNNNNNNNNNRHQKKPADEPLNEADDDDLLMEQEMDDESSMMQQNEQYMRGGSLKFVDNDMTSYRAIDRRDTNSSQSSSTLSYMFQQQHLQALSPCEDTDSIDSPWVPISSTSTNI